MGHAVVTGASRKWPLRLLAENKLEVGLHGMATLLPGFCVQQRCPILKRGHWPRNTLRE